MVKPTYTIALAAVLMVAAFAGIALVSDDAYAEEPVDVTPVKDTVIYAVGGAQLPVKANEDRTTVLYGPEDVASFYTPAADESFKYWKDNNSETIYQFGATITVPEGGLVLVPGVVKITTATFVSEDATLIIAPGKLAENETKIVKMQTAADGFKFLGWTSSADKSTDSADVKYYIYDADSDKFVTNDESKTPYTVEAGVTMTAQFQELYTISWVVDKTIYMGDVSDIKMPTAPTMANHTFLGWADENGKVVIEPDATAEEISKVIEALTGDATFTAKFKADQYTVTLMVGDDIYGTATATYGVDFVIPALPDNNYAYWATKVVKEVTGEDGIVTTVEEYVEFTSKSVTADMTLYAIESDPEVPSDVFTVTFVVDGKTIATYDSNSVTLPDTPVKEGYQFMGWTINNAVIADPVNYEFTADTQFVALFQAIDVTTYTVTIQMASGTTQNIEVAEGAVAELPALAEGKVWALGDEIFNPETAIATDIVLKEVDEYYTVSFAVNGTVYDAYAQEVKYGEKASAPAQFVFPDGYSGWDFNFDTVITSDITVNAALIPAPAEEPAFYETTTGQVAIVIVVFALLFFGYAVYSNMGGIKDKLFGYTISKKEKKE